jgi:GNAT superfamily N-acetyltransferase
VHTTPGRDAVALWLPAGPHSSDPAGYAGRLAAVTGPWTGRFMAFDAALAEHHPASPAHWHLAMLAVRPHRQGRGTGTALLAAGHAMTDDQGEPAYLEATSPRARDLYQRHGYTPAAPFHLPGGGPPLWPMWRPPGGRRSGPAAGPGAGPPAGPGPGR